MKGLRLPTLLLLLPLLAGCASVTTVASSVVLGPGGRAEARIASAPSHRLRLVNRGPGRVDFVLRDAAGGVRAEGALGRLTSRWTGDPAEAGGPRAGPLVLVLEAYPDEGGATVEWTLEGEGGADVSWDLARAHP